MQRKQASNSRLIPGSQEDPDATPKGVGVFRILGRTTMPPRKGRTCVVCTATFNASYPDQRTCGRACGTAINGGYARRPRKNWPCSKVSYVDCPECHRVFTKHNRQAFCSVPCRQAAGRRRRGQVKAWGNQPKARVRPCPGCGTDSLVWPRQLCGSCFQANRTARKARDKRRRRALKRGVRSEPYTLAGIAQRDDYRCGLCGRPVPMGLQVPDPLAPTVDHVVPLACRGDDTPANVQLAHFICNSMKGAQDLSVAG